MAGAHLNAGLTGRTADLTMRPSPNAWIRPMSTPPPSQPSPQPPNRPVPFTPPAANDAQMLAWLRLRQEMLELHARLEYIKLMLKINL
jgi:hypothetical protein